MQNSSATRLATAGVVVLMLANASCAPAVPEARVHDEIGAAMFAELSERLEESGGAGQAMGDADAVPGMIIWAETSGSDPKGGGPDVVDIERPIRVWLYADGAWSEPTEMDAAIEEYLGRYVHGGVGMERWAMYSFAITSISAGGTQAEVMVNWTCGGLCGMGTLHKLQRNATGQWEFGGEEMIWIS